MLGKCVRAKVVTDIGSVSEDGYVCPLNYAVLYDSEERYAFIMGIDHPVRNFDGRIIAALVPKGKGKKIWILAPKSTRFINVDILKYINVKRDFPDYRLECLYESSSGAVIFREIMGDIRYLLIKNKRSANWGFPKGHIEMGETKEDAARREIFEETGIHLEIIDGFESESRYKIRDKIDKRVSIFVGTTKDTDTKIQESEIEDYIWLTYEKAVPFLNYENDKKILIDAHQFLLNKGLI